MEHYSQQTSRRKPICITDVVIHGNVCDLSTKADEDPKITGACQHQEAKCQLCPLLSKVHTLPTRQIQHPQIPGGWGAPEKAQI